MEWACEGCVSRALRAVGGDALRLHPRPVTSTTTPRHRHGVDALRSLGRDLERQVLARAVKANIQDRIIVDGNKTVVF